MGLLIGVAIFGTPLNAQRPPTPEEKAARIALVKEFIREVQDLYGLQQTAKKEFAENQSSDGQTATGIRVGTRTLLEMDQSIRRLTLIPVTGRWAETRDLLKRLHEQRMELFLEMTENAKNILSGPRPGVDYGAMAARAPELTALVENNDKAVFQMSQVMFFALVDEGRQGPDGNLHHLILTKTERASIVQSIDRSFGPALDDKNATHIVLSAWAIKHGLTGTHYKAADEP